MGQGDGTAQEVAPKVADLAPVTQSTTDAFLIIGGVLQVAGVVLTAIQIYAVRKKYRDRFGPEPKTTSADLMDILQLIADLAYGGWKWGIASVSLIVIGIICTTVGAVMQ